MKQYQRQKDGDKKARAAQDRPRWTSPRPKKAPLELVTSPLSRAYHLPEIAKRNRLQPWKMTEDGEKLIPEGPFAAFKEIESRRGGKGRLTTELRNKGKPAHVTCRSGVHELAVELLLYGWRSVSGSSRACGGAWRGRLFTL